MNLKAKQLIEAMSLEEKAGQVMMEDFVGHYDVPAHSADAIRKGKMGAIIYFSGCNVIDGMQLKKLTKKVVSIGKQGRLKLPPLIAIDQECGQLAAVFRKQTVHPGTMAIGAIGEDAEKNSYKLGRVTGDELRSIGIHWNLSPVMDVVYDDTRPIVDNRYFSSNPKLVARQGAAYIQGIQSKKIMATAKHFPGQRIVEIDSHFQLDVVPYKKDRLEKVELVPFKAAIKAGVQAIMTIHAAYTAYDPSKTPATLSKKIVTGLLRNTLKFDGIIITDDMQMEPVKKKYGLDGAVVKALQAGCDMVILSEELYETYKVIVDAVKRGFISEDRLNDAVYKILTAKEKCFKLPEIPMKDALYSMGSAAHKECVNKVAVKSITLIQNEKHKKENAKKETKDIPLKLKSTDRLVIIRPWFYRLVMSDSTNLYTHTMLEAFKKRHKNTVEVIMGLNPNDKWEMETWNDWAFVADAFIFCTINAYMYKGQLQVMKEIADTAQSKPAIAVALRSPYDVLYYPDEYKTRLVTYGVTEASIEGLARVIFGESKPAGKLPVNIGKKYKIGTGMSSF